MQYFGEKNLELLLMDTRYKYGPAAEGAELQSSGSTGVAPSSRQLARQSKG